MSPRFKTIITNAVLFCAGLLLWGAALEVGSRWWLRHYGDQLDRAMLLLEADTELLWRQKPYFCGTFEGRPVRTDAKGLRDGASRDFNSAPQRILVLGPSSTFGWGVGQNDPYPQQLENLLEKEYPGAAVLNAGEIGYSAAQGLALYKLRLRQLKPGLIVIAYGANDPDRHRFFSNSPEPDACLLSPPEALKRKLNCLAQHGRQLTIPYFKTIYLASRLSGKIKTGFSCPAQQAAPVPPLRQPPEEFKQSLLALARAASDNGARLLFVTTAHNFPAAPLLPKNMEQQSALLQDKAAQALDSGQASEAAALLAQAAQLNPYDAKTRYLLSAALARQGQCIQARRETAVARRLEQYRLHADYAAYNKIVKEAAALSGAAVLDLENRLAGAQASEIFLDPIHFSVKGNALVARELQGIIESRKLLKEDKK